MEKITRGRIMSLNFWLGIKHKFLCRFFFVLLIACFLISCQREASDKNLEKKFTKGPIEVIVSLSPSRPNLLDIIELKIKVFLLKDYELTFPDVEKEIERFLYIVYS